MRSQRRAGRGGVQQFNIRLHVTEDGRVFGEAKGIPAGDHDVAIILHQRGPHPAPEQALAAIHALQDEIARLPVLDPRKPDEILGYDETGLFRSW